MLNNRTLTGGVGGGAPHLPLIHAHKSADDRQSKRKGTHQLPMSEADARARAQRANRAMRDRDAQKASLVKALRAIGLTKKSVGVNQCHGSFYLNCCGRCAGEWVASTFSCKVRLCPWCARARAARLVAQFEPVLAGMRDPRYIVLTVRNSPIGELRPAIRHLFAAFNRMRKTTLWRSLVLGCVVVLEVTLNERENTWHPHLNVVYDGTFINQKELQTAWRRAARDESLIMPWIKRADKATIQELFKYTLKPFDFGRNPEAVSEFLGATRRMRLVRTYGSAYGAAGAAKDRDGQERDTCPDCGSTEVRKLGIVLRLDDVSYDGQGILRPRARLELVRSCGICSHDD